jgi:OmpA-OmpF porin, OOP family
LFPGAYMHQPLKWWPGLLAIVPLWAVCTAWRTNAIETELATRARAALAAKGAVKSDETKDAGVLVAGRDVTLSGVGVSAQGGDTAVEVVDSARGVRRVRADFTPPAALAVAKPYVFSARRAGGQFSIDGVAPSAAARGKILAAANATGAGAVVDAMKLANGAPTNYDEATAYAIAQASRLSSGAASISDGAYSISGEAPSFEVYDAAIAATKRLPQGLTLAKADIAPPVVKPYAWSAQRAAKIVALTGYAPSDAALEAIVARATAVFPGAKIDNRMRVARGAPSGDFAAAASFALAELAKLSEGRASYTDAALSVSGAGLQGVSGQTVDVDARAGLPRGFSLAAVDVRELVVPPVAPPAAEPQPPAPQVAAPPPQVVAPPPPPAVAPSPPAAATPAPQAASAPPLKSTIAKEDADACQADLRAALAAGKIEFSISIAKIRRGSKGVLDHVAAAAKNCAGKGAVIEVSGHTDNRGKRDRNVDLSRDRAQAVVDYLVEAGVEKERLTAVGEGPDRPIASNGTVAGRQANRRIEMTIK